MSGEEVAKKVPHDVVTEQILLAAALVSKNVRARLVMLLPNDAFISRKHSILWAAVRRIEEAGLDVDQATLMQFCGDAELVRYATALMEAKPLEPAKAQVDHHVSRHMWDVSRVRCMRGPINAFLEAAKDPTSEPGKVRGLARAITMSLEGYEHRKWLYDGEQLARTVGMILDERSKGLALWPTGIPVLDAYEDDHPKAGRARLIPGLKPGMVTVITGISGGGKSLLAAHLALLAAKNKRRALYGAWEPQAEDLLEQLAALDLGLSASRIKEGLSTPTEIDAIKGRALDLGQSIRIMGNPFLLNEDGREGESSNRNNLEAVAGYIADTGADIFIADLWERCLVLDHEERDTRNALFMQQRIAQRLNVHVILLVQQRLKDIEARDDKRPTREGIKGTSAFVDVADLILAPYMPHLFKDLDEELLEIIILKQRQGKWPQTVRFPYNADTGQIGTGRTVVQESRVGDTGNALDAALDQKVPRRQGKK